MSTASRQSIVLLAVVHGVFQTMYSLRLHKELEPTILYGVEVSGVCVKNFPETGNAKSNLRWMTEKLHHIDAELNKSESLYTMIVLTEIVLQILTDLDEKIQDKYKQNYIIELEEIIKAISDEIDNGMAFKAYIEAENILNRVYNIIGFSRKE